MQLEKRDDVRFGGRLLPDNEWVEVELQEGIEAHTNEKGTTSIMIPVMDDEGRKGMVFVNDAIPERFNELLGLFDEIVEFWNGKYGKSDVTPFDEEPLSDLKIRLPGQRMSVKGVHSKYTSKSGEERTGCDINQFKAVETKKVSANAGAPGESSKADW